MDLIKFSGGEKIFRFPGRHSFVPGSDFVVSVEPVMTTLPEAMQEKTEPVIKNLCGKFTTFLDGYFPHGSVSNPKSSYYFGKHQTMYHLHGSVSVHCGVVFFKGCSGCRGLQALSEDLFLKTPSCLVHMGVFKACLGRRLDTHDCCCLEKSVSSQFKSIRTVQRLIDSAQVVRLRIDKFDEEELPHLRGALVPTSVDLSITSTGVLLLRFSWSNCAWSEEAEATTLRFCAWVRDTLRECC